MNTNRVFIQDYPRSIDDDANQSIQADDLNFKYGIRMSGDRKHKCPHVNHSPIRTPQMSGMKPVC